MSKKGFAPIITVLIITLLVGSSVGSYLYLQSKNKSMISTTTTNIYSPITTTTTIQKDDSQGEVKIEEEKTYFEPSEKQDSPEQSEGGSYLVTRVIDGDTIEIEDGKKVRYIGIDTPETVDPRKPVQCFGVEASNRNKQLVEGKKVRLEKDVSEIDKYGRLLRYVYVDGVFVNLVLVQEGFAYSYTYPPDIKYQNQFTEAQRLAREQKKGLWGSCPVSTTSLTVTTTPTTQPSLTCTIKGNISSSNEKIYHLIGCGSYNVTKIDEARGERWFCTEEEAVAAGWRKA